MSKLKPKVEDNRPKCLRSKINGKFFPYSDMLVRDEHMEELIIKDGMAYDETRKNADRYELSKGLLRRFGVIKDTPVTKPKAIKKVAKKKARPKKEPTPTGVEDGFGVDNI